MKITAWEQRLSLVAGVVFARGDGTAGFIGAAFGGVDKMAAAKAR
jgi:hypothetical protein